MAVIRNQHELSWRLLGGGSEPTFAAIDVAAGEAGVVNLAGYQHHRFELDGWDNITTHTVSNAAHSTHVLSVDGHDGVVTGGEPSSGSNDRYLRLTNLEAADAEVRCEFDLHTTTSQFGFALRGDDSEAVIVWTNIVFGVNTNVIWGIWEFGSDSLNETNQQSASLEAPDGINHYPTRRMAARLVGDTIRFKQWLPGMSEPDWDDPDWATSGTLPETLAGSGAAPPSTGNVGMVHAHLGNTGAITVRSFSVKHILV